MPIEVAVRLSQDLPELDGHLHLIWHAGEPLAVGRDHLSRLFAQFEPLRKTKRLTHSIQTNATLIDRAWCDFFLDYEAHVGISVDGPPELNCDRKDWSGRQAYSRILDGVATLKEHDVPFTAIAVVKEESLGHPEALYSFFQRLGCSSVGFNILEKEGVQSRSGPDDHRVLEFWSGLFTAWRRDPSLDVREFVYALSWMRDVVGEVNEPQEPESLITITHAGDLILLSPEFAGMGSTRYSNFVAGNVTQDRLSELIAGAAGHRYVRDFLRGVEACRESCRYFGFCGGGSASNKYFENGDLSSTETTHCRNSKVRLIDAVLTRLQEVQRCGHT